MRINVGRQGNRVLFGFPDYSADQTPNGLYRSVDSGLSWTLVFPATDTQAPEPVVSPTFADDGLALLAVRDTIYRSTDEGATWTTLASWPNWRVHQIVFSPDFGADRTIFASASAGGFRGDTGSREEYQAFLAAIGGDGDLFKSTDGGMTWTSSSVGLELDGVPARHIEAIAVSPNFAQDRTAFAYAFGVDSVPGHTGPSGQQVSRAALFVTADGGASWRFLWERPSSATWTAAQASIRYLVAPGLLVLSPQFGVNGIALMAVHSAGPSPHNGFCQLYRTADFGQTWIPSFSEPPAGLTPYSCQGLAMAGQDGRTAIWMSTRDGYSWSRSLDGGATVQGLHVGGPGPSAVSLLADGTVMEAWQEGIRILPSSAQIPAATR